MLGLQVQLRWTLVPNDHMDDRDDSVQPVIG